MRDFNFITQLRPQDTDDWKTWVSRFLLTMQQQFSRAPDVVELTSYTVAKLPRVGKNPGLIFVSDETGGAVPAFSDGTNWRRVTDRAIVS